MLPGPDLIIKCPSCGMLQCRGSWASGNDIGAEYYSDGLMDAPMLPSFPNVVRCPECCKFFKIIDKIVIGRVYGETMEAMGECPDGWENAPVVEFLTIDEYRKAIEEGLCNSGRKDGKQWKKDILSLRFALWQACNDGRRYKSEYDANCREMLATMAHAHDDGSLLTKAELHRNLGEFEQCTSLLSKVKDQDKYSLTIASIRKACADKNTITVRVIDWEDIFEVAMYGNVQDVKDLLEKGHDGISSLLWAALYNPNIAVFKYLISKGADIDTIRDGNRTPLVLALYEKKLELAKFIISQGANVNIGDTVYNAVTRCESLEIVKMLVSKGANVNADVEYTFHGAVKSGNFEIVKFLVSQGADIHVRDVLQNTPLHHALENIKVMSYLISKGADVNAKNRHGDTPLHNAIGNIKVMAYLISRGADVNAKNNNGETPLDRAIEVDGNNISEIRFLKSIGAKITHEQP